MEKEFVPYEQALALKELGFDEMCLTQWGTTSNKLYLTVFKPRSNKDDDVICGDMIAAPLHQQAFRWFREEHGLMSEVFISDDGTYGYLISEIVELGRMDYPVIRDIESHKEAEIMCLNKLIEIVKESENEA